ncbi:MAG: family 43 glycosylhydrolase [Planctomycetota bacterium]
MHVRLVQGAGSLPRHPGPRCGPWAAGSFTPLTEGPITPADWECLDGTLHVDAAGAPWIVFCHEWVQVHNGAMYAMQLSPDLKQPAGRPVFLFNASEAPWVKRPAWPDDKAMFRFPTYITDGPFLYRTGKGILLMLWSSVGGKGYAMGVARSESGGVTGPWRQDAAPLWAEDGGHGMIFHAVRRVDRRCWDPRPGPGLRQRELADRRRHGDRIQGDPLPQ